MTVLPAAAESPSESKRRKYSIAEKRRIVEETFEPGASVARVARAHGVNANQVFGWRRLYLGGRLGAAVQAPPAAKLLPVTIAEPPAAVVPALAPAPEPARLQPGTIHLQIPRGRLRVEGAVDPEALRVILQCMLALITIPTGAQIWIAAGVTQRAPSQEFLLAAR
jgi:transposase